MDRFDGVKEWVTDHPRRAAAVAGAAVVLTLAFLLLLSGGEDVAPVTGGSVESTAANTEAANGTLAADDTAQPGAGGVAAGTDGDSAVPSATASAPDPEGQRTAAAHEQVMNAGLVMPPGLDSTSGDAPVSSPPVNEDDVQFAGNKLDHVGDLVQGCLDAKEGDIFECLKRMPDGYRVKRIFETAPQGAHITVDGIGFVGLQIRGDIRCRTLGTATDCNAWSPTSG